MESLQEIGKYLPSLSCDMKLYDISPHWPCDMLYSGNVSIITLDKRLTLPSLINVRLLDVALLTDTSTLAYLTGQNSVK